MSTLTNQSRERTMCVLIPGPLRKLVFPGDSKQYLNYFIWEIHTKEICGLVFIWTFSLNLIDID